MTDMTTANMPASRFIGWTLALSAIVGLAACADHTPTAANFILVNQSGYDIADLSGPQCCIDLVCDTVGPCFTGYGYPIANNSTSFPTALEMRKSDDNNHLTVTFSGNNPPPATYPFDLHDGTNWYFTLKPDGQSSSVYDLPPSTSSSSSGSGSGSSSGTGPCSQETCAQASTGTCSGLAQQCTSTQSQGACYCASACVSSVCCDPSDAATNAAQARSLGFSCSY